MSIKEDHTERKHGVQESEEELKKLDVRFLEQPGTGNQSLYGSNRLYGTYE